MALGLLLGVLLVFFLKNTIPSSLQVSRTFEQCDVEAVLLQHGAHDPDAKLFPLSAAAAELKSAAPPAAAVAAAAPAPAPAPAAAPPATAPAAAPPAAASAAPAPPTPVATPQPKAKASAPAPPKLDVAPSSGPAAAAAAVPDVLHPSPHLLHPSSRTEEAEAAKVEVKGSAKVEADAAKVEAKESEAVGAAAKEAAISMRTGSIAKGSASAEASAAAATAGAPAPVIVPGWSTVSAAMAWAQDPSNATMVVTGASCVMALAAAFLLGGPRKMRR